MHPCSMLLRNNLRTGGTFSGINTAITGEALSDLLAKGKTFMDTANIEVGLEVLGRQSIANGDTSGDITFGGDSVKYNSSGDLTLVNPASVLAGEFTVTDRTIGEVAISSGNANTTITLSALIKAITDDASIVNEAKTLYLMIDGGSATATITPDSGYCTGEVSLNGETSNVLSHMDTAVTQVLTAKDTLLSASAEAFHINENISTGITKSVVGNVYTLTGTNLAKPTVQKANAGNWIAADDVTIEGNSSSYTVTFPGTLNADYKLTATIISSSGSGGGGGGGSTATYAVTSEKTENGNVTTSKTNAEKGAKVTITVTPDDGYDTDYITITDAKGNNVEVTKNDDGTYSYIQPASKVTVNTVFKKAENETDINPTGNGNRFKDVTSDKWYFNAVNRAAELGIVNGVSDDTYEPETPLTRAMFAAMIYRYAGSPETDYEFEFTDVAKDMWYTDAIRWAASQGIISGYNRTTFAPDNKITREQVVAMIYRYAVKTVDVNCDEKAADSFSDSDRISEYAKLAMAWAVDNSVMNGRSNKTLAPADNVTRAEIAQIFINYIDNVK